MGIWTTPNMGENPFGPMGIWTTQNMDENPFGPVGIWTTQNMGRGWGSGLGGGGGISFIQWEYVQ